MVVLGRRNVVQGTIFLELMKGKIFQHFQLVVPKLETEMAERMNLIVVDQVSFANFGLLPQLLG